MFSRTYIKKEFPIKFFGRLVESVFVSSTATFLGKLSFWRFFFFVGFWKKVFCLMVNETQRGFSFYVSRKFFFALKNHKIAQMFSFLALTAKKSLRIFFGGLLKIVLVLSAVTFRGKLFLWKFIFFLPWILNNNSTPYGKWNSASLLKLPLTCWEDHFSR